MTIIYLLFLSIIDWKYILHFQYCFHEFVCNLRIHTYTEVYTLHFFMSTLHPDYTDDIFNLSIPVLAVDIVLFTLYKDQLCVVLVPGRNEWAHGKLTLPGGIIGRGETLEEAADRILERDTNISHIYKEQLYTFSAHNRDDR